MKKIGLLALALVLALGTLGVGYAMWFEDLYIYGTVNTGTLDAEWSIEAVGDSETAEKDVSSITASYDSGYLYIIITGAYPCIDYWVNFDVDNLGTIPFHVCPITCTTTGFPGTVSITAIENPDSPDTPYQVHPGESAYGTITVHLFNEYPVGSGIVCEENSQYTFSCAMKVVQYNEACP